MSAGAALMACLAFVSVGLWTLRVALTARGRIVTSAAVAAIEAVVFALVFSRLVTDLGSWDKIAGYAIGVALGTVAGLLVNDRLSSEGVMVEVTVAGDGGALRTALHSRDLPATTFPVADRSGTATVLLVVVPRERIEEALAVVWAHTPNAFCTTLDTERDAGRCTATTLDVV